MPEVRYTALPELRHPGRFLSAAVKDLRAASGIVWRLYAGYLKARHRRSLLGFIWLLAPTLATTVACVHLRSLNVISAGPADLPYPVFVLAGTIFWQVFIDALNAPLQQLSMARQLITRSRVPHEALILAGVLDVLLNCALRLAILAGALFAFDLPLGPTLLMVPLGIASLTLLGLAIGVMMAPFGLLYDDVGRGVSTLAVFLFFLTPVAYSVPAAGGSGWNPVSPLIETTRAWLFSQGAAEAFLPVTAAASITLILAWLFYRLARPHLVARLG